MAFPVTINGRTYTLADFEGTNYVDGFPDALEDFVTQAGDIYNSTSSSSVAIGTGSKTFTIADSGKPYQAGTPLRIADAAAPETNFMDCIVTSYSGTTLVVDSFGYAGSGTKTSWTVNIGGAKTVDGTLAVSQGGTGATTAAAARTALGVGTGDSPTFAGIDVTGTVTADGLNLTKDDYITWDSGLGTTTRLKAYGTYAQAVQLEIDTAGIYSSSSFFQIVGGSPAETLLRVDRNGDISFYEDTGTTAKFFWDASAESLGIGTTSPSEKLEIFGNAILTTGYKIYGNANTGLTSSYLSLYNAVDGGIDLMANYTTSKITFGTAGSERMRIDSSGNVGIGTTSPAAKLEIGGAGEGIILASPDGTRYKITVANGGILIVTAV